jgi:uncharacterized delta-60 repeat protein
VVLAGMCSTAIRGHAALPDEFNPGADRAVINLAVQPDGKILVVGRFNLLGGLARLRMARLEADGSVDPSFTPVFGGGGDPSVYSLVVQPDGKVVVGGGFSEVAGEAQARIARLHADGALDASFRLGADNYVLALALQANGGLLMGGDFGVVGQEAHRRIARVNADGSLDASFNPSADNRVHCLAEQADGRILVGGWFTKLNEQPRSALGRLEADGSLDVSFDPVAAEGTAGSGTSVYCLLLQPDGKILVGGDFTKLGGQPRKRFGRLNADGTLDTSFDPGADNSVYSMVLQADGRILVAGQFLMLGGQLRARIGRLNADGTLDAGFDVGANGNVFALGLQPEGEVLVGGEFAMLGGQPRRCLGRLTHDDPAEQSVTRDGSTVTWVRGGAVPEVWRARFETSADGTNWLALGLGSRIPGGWVLGGAALTPQQFIRARGQTIGGYFASGVSWVDAYSGPAWVIEQPSGRTNDAGTTVRFSVRAIGTAPLEYQWFKDGVALTDDGRTLGAQTSTVSLGGVGRTDEGSYSVTVSNAEGTGVSQSAHLTVEFNPGANGVVSALVEQDDGRILAAGTFTTLGGETRNGIGRLTADGALDRSFDSQAGVGGGAPVHGLAVVAGGDLLLGGGFVSLCGLLRDRMGRLRPDGSINGSFYPGANSNVLALALQPDGKILVGGEFTIVSGKARRFLARLNPDGAVDMGFVAEVNHSVQTLAVQADGRILIGGAFSTVNGQPRLGLARLAAGGALDDTFNPGTGGGETPAVWCLLCQADGRILVGGDFLTLAGQPRQRIGRLEPDGTLDAGFDPGADGTVWSLALQTDGSVLLGGAFAHLGGQLRERIGRFDAAGVLDDEFNPRADGDVCALAILRDGAVLVGGAFGRLNEQPRSRVGRLANTGPASEVLGWEGSTLRWRRTGTGPEVQWVSFSNCTNGVVWSPLGAGTRIPGGWELRSLAGPIAGVVRVQAVAVGGCRGASSAWIETDVGPPLFSRQPFDVTRNAATNVTLSAAAVGSEPFGFRWFRNGVAMENGGTVSGADSATLMLSRLSAADAGRYTVVVSNALGVATSEAAVLNVIDPAILVQPAGLIRNAGETATFSVVAAGNDLMYQWSRNGVARPGAVHADLTLTNVSGADAGRYTVSVVNRSGRRTSEAAVLTVVDPAILTQPLGAQREIGEGVTFSVTAAGTALIYQWLRDGVPMVGATGSSLTLTNLGILDCGGYAVTVGGTFGEVTSAVAELAVVLRKPEESFAPAADGWVNAWAIEPDGSILVGGQFTHVDGNPRNRIGRLNPDGTVEETFNPDAAGGADPGVYALAVDANGEILVAGGFLTLGGRPRARLARLHSDGTVDEGFNPGADNLVQTLALQADGRILVGGDFTRIGGRPRSRIARLNRDGSVDPLFVPAANDSVGCMAEQPDGKIVVGGRFTTLDGQSRRRMGRLQADGTLDPGFTLAPGGVGTAQVYGLACQPDGRIVVAGYFTTIDLEPHNYIGRLNADGTLDASFDPRGGDRLIDTVALQADGRILVGGGFRLLGGQSRSGLGRLNANGTADLRINPGIWAWEGHPIRALAVQRDGRILLGGTFDSVGGWPRSRIARMGNTDPAVQSLVWDGSVITWSRGGSSPEVVRVQFEASSDGHTWERLGAGARIPGGWRLDGVSPPSGSTIRAQGYVVGGYQNASSWHVEESAGPPALVSLTPDRTNQAGGLTRLRVVAAGTGPLTYQWYKDGVPLQSGGNVSGGATNAFLVCRDLLGADSGSYTVRIAGPLGVVTSGASRLTVIDPVIQTQPADGEKEVGDSMIFAVSALGTTLNYQWWHDGAALPGANGPSLTLTNLSRLDAGGYRVVVTGSFGSATSVVAQLAVVLSKADPGFAPPADGPVLAWAIESDGRILVGGRFAEMGGIARLHLARLATDGSVDPSFSPAATGGSDPAVYAIAVEEDGNILVAGGFTTLAGQPRTRLARLHPDGTLDGTFYPEVDATVLALGLQADGKILVGGDFTSLGGQPRSRLGRLNRDGSVDTSFAVVANSRVCCLTEMSDGAVLVGGWFARLNGVPRNALARLSSDGVLDPSFTPGAGGGPYPYVYCLLPQADGRILVAGDFLTLNGQPRAHIGRLHADGSLDTAYNPGANGPVYTLAQRADGRILMGGSFLRVGGQERPMLALLDNDGVVDSWFDVGADDIVQALMVQPDGATLMGGAFHRVGGETHTMLARINKDEPAVRSLAYDGITLEWTLGGSSPAVAHAVFEISGDGMDWELLGKGIRIPGGWGLDGVSLDVGRWIRARGLVKGGHQTASSWYIESRLVVTEATASRCALRVAIHDGSPVFEAIGRVGTRYALEYTLDLTAGNGWTALPPFLLTRSPLVIGDPTPPTLGHRFYRLQRVP